MTPRALVRWGLAPSDEFDRAALRSIGGGASENPITFTEIPMRRFLAHTRKTPDGPAACEGSGSKVSDIAKCPVCNAWVQTYKTAQ